MHMGEGRHSHLDLNLDLNPNLNTSIPLYLNISILSDNINEDLQH